LSTALLLRRRHPAGPIDEVLDPRQLRGLQVLPDELVADAGGGRPLWTGTTTLFLRFPGSGSRTPELRGRELKRSRGIRAEVEWLISLATRRTSSTPS